MSMCCHSRKAEGHINQKEQPKQKCRDRRKAGIVKKLM